jgi:hypothetical protein
MSHRLSLRTFQLKNEVTSQRIATGQKLHFKSAG